MYIDDNAPNRNIRISPKYTIRPCNPFIRDQAYTGTTCYKTHLAELLSLFQ